MWNILRTVKKGPYLYAVVPDHPRATKHGYVLHHRVVMENALGRTLSPLEVVHHKDENGHNNAIENLELMDLHAHARHHASTGRKTFTLICPNCGVEFTKLSGQIKAGSTPKCSRRCNGQFSRRLQMAA